MSKPVKIAIIGAGSGVFSLGLVKDLCVTPNLHDSEVSFMDLNPERLDIVHSLARRYADELGTQMRFEKTLNRVDALTDADFVINTASAKTHQSQRRERELTGDHGYYYGGANLHAPFENFDLMLSVAHDVELVCPDAWVIQSGNTVFDGSTLLHRESHAKII